jgi:hypothetical protein
VVVLAVALGACRQAPRSASAAKPATLVPPDLALAFLKEIKSQPSQSLLAGETTIPPCQFADKGTGSAGEYRKVTGQRAPNQVTSYEFWTLAKIEEPGGRDLTSADLNRGGAWNYALRTPRGARTVFGTIDHCIVGPTAEPVRKVVEALTALGVGLAPEYGYIVR